MAFNSKKKKSSSVSINMQHSSAAIKDIDNVIEEFSNFGCYQILNMTLLCIPICFNAVLTLSYVFTASRLEYRCRIPECDINNSNEYFQPWLKFALPPLNGNQCVRYKSLVDNNATIFFNQNTCSAEKFDNSSILGCNDVIYKTDENTIAKEWNLICPDNEWKLSLVGSMNNVGQLIGIPLGGLVSDRFGRRFALVAAASLSSVVGLIRSCSVNYIMFVIFEFMDTLVGSITFSAAWILSIELIPTEKRAFACTLISVFFSCGEMILGVAAKYTRDWRLLLRVFYGPALLHVTLFWILPESIKWLMSKGRINEALKVLKKAAKINGEEEKFQRVIENMKIVENNRYIGLSSSEKLQMTTQEKPPGVFTQLHEAFKSKRMVWRIVNCSFCWFTNILVYYGLSLNSVSLAGDKYVNFILVCAMEIPGYLLCYFFVDKVKRRISMCGTMLACGLMLGLQLATSKGALVLFLLGKVAITMSFTVLYVYTTEMFPTNIRHSILSFCSMFGRFGSIIAPQTPLMAHLFSSLPLILFASCAIASGLLSLYFPETLNRTLPKNLQEAEAFEKINKNKEQAYIAESTT